MPRILRSYSYAQLVLVLSLVLLLVSLPVAQNRVAWTSPSPTLPSATGTGVGEVSTNVARPDHSPSVISPVSTKQSAQADLTNSSAKTKEAYGLLPLSFTANSGQTNGNVKFLARGPGYGLFLTSTGPVVSLSKNSEKKTSVVGRDEPATDTAVVSWELVGAKKSPRISGSDALPGKANYFRGNDPSQWRSNISTYAKVRYSNVYPGIDVVYYGNQRQLEYDFIVAPGKDPNRIKLNFKGADTTVLNADGNLILKTQAGEITQAKPFAYQEIAGVRHEILASYQVDARGVSFNLGDYDRSRPLVIDPVFIYSSFLGGTSFEVGFAVAVDAQGSAYLTGRTSSLDFPIVNAVQSTFAASTDAYVVKLNPSGTALIYSTYLGGDSSESGRGVAVDNQGSAYIAGSTFSTNFPTTPGALQASRDLLADGYLTKLSVSGSSLVYSTYLGGDNTDNITGLAVTADGRAVVTGGTDSSRFSTNAFPTPRNGHSTFKSMDKAAQWSVSDNGLTSASVNTFAIDPANSSIVFAACRTGLFKSTDAGGNWSRLPLPVPAGAFYGVTSVVIDPSNSAIVYAGTDDGVFKSTDGGASFIQKVSLFNVFALAIDSLAPTTLYAGTLDGVFKTTNGGNDWADLNTTLGGNTPLVYELVIDPSNSAVVYLGTSDGMFKSTNGGATWANINSGPLVANFPEISALTIDPTNPQILYAAASAVNSNVIKTTNGGATWAETGPGLLTIIQGQQTPVVVSQLAIDPTTPATLYAATQGGGMFKTTNSGANWNPSNTGLPTFLNGVSVDRNNPTTLYAGATIPSDGYVARFNTSGSALEYLMHFGGDKSESASGVALDTDGNAYITGTTTSTNFPTVNPLQSTLKSAYGNAFVAKLNSSGTGFLYSTYLGGSNGDSASGIAVRDGNAFVVGFTFSQDFPVVNAYKPVLAQYDTDAFVAKLNAAGTALDFSTFLGGTGSDQAFGVAVDSAGSAYVTGATTSPDFPTQSAAQFALGGTTDAFVTELNPAGNQLVYSTFLGGSASDQANAIAVDGLGSAYVTGVTSSNNFPTINAFQPVRKNSDAFFTKIGPAGLASNIQFSQSSYQINESGIHVLVVVNRNGFTSGTATVNYATSDAATGNCNNKIGLASSRCDYEASFGTLQFAAGETSKTISIPIIADSYAEGNETFTISLSNPTNASLGSPATATITILDFATVDGPNPIAQSYFFVGQHYLDFLNREADSSGRNFWVNEIDGCTPKPQCTEVKRINVSAAFFLSIEFQETGYLVERLYKVAYGDASGTSNFGPTHQLAVPIVRLNEFLPDSQEIGRGVVVGQTGWEQVLEANKVAFTNKFVQHSRFSTSYSALLTPAEFVDQLFAHAGVTPTAAERNAAINEFGGAPTSNDNPARARALRLVAENSTLKLNEKNKAFVLMQFFGYLRRNPNDPQDTDYTGYDFWLSKLNEFNGDYIRAEMVKAFLDSSEYRARFGP